MKIVHIITSLESGGAERMLSKICEFDQENQHFIITLLKAEIHYNIKNAIIIELGVKNNLINKFFLIFRIKKVVNNLKPDIVQTWMKSNFYAPFLKSFRKNKIVSNFRNGYRGTNNHFAILFYNIFLNFFDAHIFVSDSALKERESIGLKFKNKIIINNGFEIPDVPNQISDKHLTIGHMGRFHHAKNQSMLIDAFRITSSNKDVILTLAGKDLNEKNLNFNEINSNQIRVLGEIKDIEKFYNMIDVFVLTSITEGFPNVIGEAMSYGIPVISTNAGESHNILGNHGFKIESTQDLTEILNQIYADRTILKEKSLASRKRIIEKYSIEEIVKNYQVFYKDIGGTK